MAEAYIVAAARTAGGKKGGRVSGVASGRTWRQPSWIRWSSAPAPIPALVEDVIMGCVMPGRRAGIQRRAQRRARFQAARKRAGHQRGPAMRLLAAGAALRSAGRDERIDGLRDRGRRGKHEPRAHGAFGRAANEERLRHLQEPAARRKISRHPVQPIHGRRDDGEEIRPDPRRARRVRLSQPQKGHRGDASRRLQGRDPAGGSDTAGRRQGDAHRRRRHPLRRQPGWHQGREAIWPKAGASRRRRRARSATALRA